MDKIFKWFVLEDARLSIVHIAWFCSKYEPEDFDGIERFLFLFLNYCAKLAVEAKRKYLESFLLTDGRKCIQKYRIKLDTMEHFDYQEPAALEEAFRILAAIALNTYDLYLQIDLSDHDFKVDVKEFMEENKRLRTQKIMADSFSTLTSGGDADEIIDTMKYKLDTVQEKYNVEGISDLDFLTGEKKTKSGKQIMRFLLKTGIPVIDGDIGGLYSRQLWSFSAQPGSGKTRWAAIHIAYQAAVVQKIGVRFDELELSEFEVENMFIAHHIINLYSGKIKIPDKLMNTDNLSSEQRQYVESARMDLFESNGKYGRIMIRCKDIYVETMKKEALSYFKHNSDIQVWCIDYAGLLKSKPLGKYEKEKIEYERIDMGYKAVKEIAKEADIGTVLVNQFNEKGILAAYAGKKILAGHIQGGQIIQRHSDYDIAMCMTEEQEIANVRTLSTVKKRAASGFQNIPFTVDLSVSIFRQLKSNSVK